MVGSRGSVCDIAYWSSQLCVRKLCAGTVEKESGWSSRIQAKASESQGVAPNRSNPATIQRFRTTFAPYGLSETAFTPGYGLAEATLVATMKPYGEQPTLLTVCSAPLTEGRVDVAVGKGPSYDISAEADTATNTATDTDAYPETRTLVGCGLPIPNTEIAIVDPASGVSLGASRVGEVWVASPSVAAGYWRRPEETHETFGLVLSAESGQSTRARSAGESSAEKRRWLRTGDPGLPPRRRAVHYRAS